MAKNLKEMIQTLSEVEIRAEILTSWTSIARRHLEVGNKIPDEIWAKIDLAMDRMIESIPVSGRRK